MSSPEVANAHRFGYQPALDGLRAVAVAAVVAFHLDETGFTGGFLGVDTFFVLSGFLITTLLVLEWRGTRGIGLLAFWGRRARRLLPALLLLLVAVGIWAHFKVPATDLDRVRWDGIAGLFYVANWRFVVSGQSYFDLFAGASPFRHLWSLAIEEQFYLIWPLVTLGCLRLGKGRLRPLLVVTVAGIAGSALLMALLYDGADPSRAYYGTDTHAHPILVGVALALILVDRPAVTTRSRRLDALGFGALLTMAFAFAFAHDTSARLYRGGSLLFAIVVAVLIAAAVRAPAGILARALAWRPLVALGVISYGVYLWHWPVIVYVDGARTGWSGGSLALLRIALTLALAISSFFLVERPIRLRLHGRAAWLAGPIGAAVGILAVLGGTVGATAAPDFFGAEPGPTTSTTLGPVASGNPTHAVLVGDSLAASLGPGLDDALTAAGVTFEAAATPGCSILRGVTVRDNGRPFPWSRDCDRAIPPALRTVVDTEPRPDLILWLASWDAVDRVLDGERVRLGTRAGDAVLAPEVRRAADLLTRNGARLMILTVPRPVDGATATLPGLDEIRRVRDLNRLYETAAPTADGQVRVLDLAGFVCPDGRCPAEVDGVELRPDGSHFGPAGTRRVGRELAKEILTCWRDPATCR